VSVVKQGSGSVGEAGSVGDDGNVEVSEDMADESGQETCLCSCFETFDESKCYWPKC
jgi:hypothetical protein